MSVPGPPRIRSAYDIILSCLEGLSSDDYKKFISQLSRYDQDNPIGFGLVEHADRLNITRRLLNRYGDTKTPEVTYKVLRACVLNGPADKLCREIQTIRSSQMERQEDHRQKYMKSVRDKYKKMKEKFSKFQRFDLEKRYTKLLLIEKKASETERNNNLRDQGSIHLETMRRLSSGGTSTTIEDLFSQNGEEHKIVVLEGPAGIGKTMTMNKIMFDWASGKLYQGKFNYLFCITSHEVSRISGEMTLAGFLEKMFLPNCTPDEVEGVLYHSEKVIFLVDGLDEFDQSFLNSQEEGSFQKFTKESFLNCLFAKPFLKESSLLVTTRPFMSEKLPDSLEVPRFVEIMGLVDREEYFFNFFEDGDRARYVLGLIKGNETLFTLCVVPMTCWIICTVFKNQIEEGLDVNEYNTSTSIYTLYLKSLVKFQGKSPKTNISSLMMKLSALAKEGVWNQKVMFLEDDLERHGLVKSSFDSLFLNENIFQRNIEEYTCYSFFHLSVQEFFAALYYLLNEGTQSFDNQKNVHCNKQVRILLEESERRPHLASTLRFLFGLSNEKQIAEIGNLIGCNIFSRPQSVLEDWLKEKHYEPHHQALLWLYETQDEVYVRRAMSPLHDLKIEGLYFCFDEREKNLVDQSLSYCLAKSATDHIGFSDHTMNPEAFNTLAAGLSKCSSLNFEKCWFPNGDISQLCKLGGKLQKLGLKRCFLTSTSYQHLRSVIAANPSLTVLDLSENEVQDSAVRPLCEALEGRRSRLRELRLKSCGLTSRSCVYLAPIIRNRSLTILDLSGNNLGGMEQTPYGLRDSTLIHRSDNKWLFDGLKHSDCVLKELRLERCNLPSYFFVELRSVITSNRSLIKIDLSANNLNFRDIKQLFDGLRDPGCTLEELRLWRCSLRPSCCKYLLPVTSLIKLDLSANKLKACGIKHLCRGLRDAGCPLKELRLQCCGLTSSCCDDIFSVLITNLSLEKLDLTNNQLQESGVKRLDEGLRHPTCVLKELGLLTRYINVAEYRKKNGLIDASRISVDQESSRRVEDVNPPLCTMSSVKQEEHFYFEVMNEDDGCKDGYTANIHRRCPSTGVKDEPASWSLKTESTAPRTVEESTWLSPEGKPVQSVIHAVTDPKTEIVYINEGSSSQEGDIYRATK